MSWLGESICIPWAASVFEALHDGGALEWAYSRQTTAGGDDAGGEILQDLHSGGDYAYVISPAVISKIISSDGSPKARVINGHYRTNVIKRARPAVTGQAAGSGCPQTS